MELLKYLMLGLESEVEQLMNLKDKILQGEFNEAYLILKKASYNEIRNELISIAFEIESIEVYFFILSIIEKKENAKYHYLASEVLATALCHLTGAYNAALYHARKAVELCPNDISYKEHLLLYYNIPEKLISEDEAKKIALEILNVDSNNKVAKDIIDKLVAK